MKFPKSTMIGFASLAAGAIGLTAVSINNNRIQEQEARYQEIMMMLPPVAHHDGNHYSPIQQIDEQGPGTLVAAQELPVDAIPTPGYSPMPGSDPKKIIYKPVSFSIIIERTKDSVKQTGDPVWKVALVDSNGKEIETLKALSGRANKQTANRHQSGNKSPLPDGIYAIDRGGIARGPFDDIELGKGYWVPITPLFNTGRSALGFHQDPSWGKMNGESGTSGCVGLESPEATTKLVDWIKKYNVSRVIVNTQLGV